MRTSTYVTCVITLLFWISGCAQHPPKDQQPTAKILFEGLLNCVSPNTKDQDGQPTYCEASATAMLGTTLLVASDKPLVGRNALLTLAHHNLAPIPSTEAVLRAPKASSASKIEAMTITPDGQHLIVSTAFDRIDHRSAALDSYNTLLAAPASDPSSLQIISPTTRQGITSSLAIRRSIEAHLGQPYFKIEGLVALPQQRLLFGIREIGESHKSFKYAFLLIECQYRIDAKNRIELIPTFKTILDYKTAEVLPQAEGLGLSSIEFEPAHNRLYFATSHETGERMGAYFWHMTLQDLDSGKSPKLLLQEDGTPLHINNKSEGITRLDPQHLFVINDDDRETGGKLNRQPHQAVYQVIQIQEP